MEKNKICKKCSIEKTISDFDFKKSNKDGHTNICKECRREYYNNRTKEKRKIREIEKEKEKILRNGVKKCTKCNVEHPETSEFFHLRKETNKLRNDCIKCSNNKSKEYYKENREKLISEKKKKYKIDSTKQKISSSKYREKNREYNREYSENYRKVNAEKCTESKKKYYIKNRIEIIEKQKPKTREYKQKRRKNDPSFKLRENTSRAISKILTENQGSKNKSSVWKKLPYSPMELKEHLEKQFEVWMNWENYGKPSNVDKTWNIDHIIPQSLLQYDTLDHPNFIKSWSLENLRPLESIENIKKGNKYEK